MCGKRTEIHWTIQRKELRHFLCNILFRHGFSGCMEKVMGRKSPVYHGSRFPEKRPVTIRCCQNKVTPEQLKKKLEQEGETVQEHPYLPYAFSSFGL